MIELTIRLTLVSVAGIAIVLIVRSFVSVEGFRVSTWAKPPLHQKQASRTAPVTTNGAGRNMDLEFAFCKETRSNGDSKHLLGTNEFCVNRAVPEFGLR